MNPQPYKSVGCDSLEHFEHVALVADLMGGTVQVALDSVTPAHIQSGRMKLIASAYATRLPAFPDTPTIAEQGLPGFALSAWLRIVAPAGTPKARVTRPSSPPAAPKARPSRRL